MHTNKAPKSIEKTSTRVFACIMAGGTGQRAEKNIPKQFVKIKNKQILAITIENFLKAGKVDFCVVGVHKDWLTQATKIKKAHFKGENRLLITVGGEDRNSTLLNAVQFIDENFSLKPSDIIISHDAVRPFISEEIINNSIEGVKKNGICNTVIKAVDTVLISKCGSKADSLPNREEVFFVQTPQSFTFKLYQELIKKTTAEERQQATDVCSLFYKHGYRVSLIRGEPKNFKITHPHDFLVALSLTKEKIPS